MDEKAIENDILTFLQSKGSGVIIFNAENMVKCLIHNDNYDMKDKPLILSVLQDMYCRKLFTKTRDDYTYVNKVKIIDLKDEI